MSLTLAAVEAALAKVSDPYLGPEAHYALLSVPEDTRVDAAGSVWVHLQLPYPIAHPERLLAPAIETALRAAGATAVHLRWSLSVPRLQPQGDVAPLSQVRNVLVVASGKGGVGKSTTAVNLAIALAQEGARVGLLDADIYGPSVPTMMGIGLGVAPDTVEDAWFVPHVAHGVEVMSIGFLLQGDTPVVWRGPKATGALIQLVTQTRWSNLDYLVVDMPPGTGDIQLTLAQRIPVAGAIVVTTPQDIATLDAKKGIEMFRKVDIRVLGVVENMSQHVCSQCGHVESIFGSGGGAAMAAQYQTSLLAELPLERRIREQTDAGCPTVVAEPDSPAAMRYRAGARRVAAALALGPRYHDTRIPLQPAH